VFETNQSILKERGRNNAKSQKPKQKKSFKPGGAKSKQKSYKEIPTPHYVQQKIVETDKTLKYQ
jgi:hypothetical protein